MSAQVVSSASFLTAQQKSDVVVPFRIQDEGMATPIEWGLDLAWLSEENVRRGVAYAGKDLIDIIRVSYRPTESVEGGVLSNSQITKIRQRANIVKKYAKADVSLNINDDHESVDAWYNENSIGSSGRGKRWAQVIDLSIQKYKELGLTNFVSISPYNEPDYGWDQGYSNSTRKADFLATAKSLREDFDGAYDGVRICGGNTLNDDYAYEWWNYLKAQLNEGNTHQLAGSFDNYASFFQRVRAYGHHATADELHNTMEAMVGVEYGMQTGIWWGTCEHSRSQFMKATYQANLGQRLAYAEHRNNWTAAAVYRLPGGGVQAFGGTSERQAVQTKYDFVSLDRPVWYNGLPGREYVMTLPGGTGYQNGQSNAETVVDVQSGTDIMPHIDGLYKVMNVNSGYLMGLSSTPGSWASATQRKNSNTSKLMQWNVNPVPSTVGGDFSYYFFTLNSGTDVQLDILNWNLSAGADVGGYPGGKGTNEQWFLEYAGNGAFYIRSRFSAKYLEVNGGSKSVSANIQMGEFTGSDSQKWRFLPVDVTPEFEAPVTPANLQAEVHANSVALVWEPSSSPDVERYTVLRSEDGTDYYTIANQVTGTAYTDNEAVPGINYSYKVYAVDRCYNYSEPTSAVTAMATGERERVVHLPLATTLNDTTLNGNHAAIYGNLTWADGREEGTTALSLSGTNNFVQLPYTVAGSDEITIACWVYWRGGNAWQRLWDFGTGTEQYMFFSPRTDLGMRFAIKNGGSEQQLRSSKNLTANTWVHVTLTLSAEGAVLYINGERAVSNTKVTIRPSDFRPVFNYIGRSQFSADPYFNGLVSDFRIYNYALTADEVMALQSGDPTNAVAPLSSEAGLESGAPVYDLSGRRIQSHARGLQVQKGRKRFVQAK